MCIHTRKRLKEKESPYIRLGRRRVSSILNVTGAKNAFDLHIRASRASVYKTTFYTLARSKNTHTHTHVLGREHIWNINMYTRTFNPYPHLFIKYSSIYIRHTFSI